MTLLLASRSAARRAMLEAAAVPFACVDTDLDEEAAKARLTGEGFGPLALAGELARLKALGVASAPAGTFVLGADQVLERADGSTLSKPGSRAEAFAQIRSLSGATHKLHSAAAIVESGKTVWAETESVSLTMRDLGDAFLDTYLDREYENIRWSVGGYRIEGPGVQLFDHIRGSHFAIMGLPLLPLMGYLRERGVLAS